MEIDNVTKLAREKGLRVILVGYKDYFDQTWSDWREAYWIIPDASDANEHTVMTKPPIEDFATLQECYDWLIGVR